MNHVYNENCLVNVVQRKGQSPILMREMKEGVEWVVGRMVRNDCHPWMAGWVAAEREPVQVGSSCVVD